MTSTFPVPPSPGVGLRRKGPKDLPKLPLSAFSGPNTAGSESFPLAPSPSTIHPEKILDGNVAISSGDLTLSKWSSEAGQTFGNKLAGVVALLPDANESTIESFTSAISKDAVTSVSVPLSASPSTLPSASVPVSFYTSYTSSTSEGISALKWALQQGRPVDIDVKISLTDTKFEEFEDFLTKATDFPEGTTIPPIIISNLLPPPDNLELPIVKLISHEQYREFQRQVASLSLFATAHVKLLPPAWDSSIPPTPSDASVADTDVSQKKEWKRRIKMYVGPVIEAFGFSRIMFGSSGASSAFGGAGAWYELARESLAELAIEQEDIDAVFAGTAKKVYGA